MTMAPTTRSSDLRSTSQPPAKKLRTESLLQHVTRDLYSLSSIQAYLPNKTDINARDCNGNTVLMLVLRRCYQPMQLYDTCRLLLSAGCDINAVNEYNISATVYLCHHINRSLSFHRYADNPYTVAELDTVKAANDKDIMNVLCAQDKHYQQQVHECLKLFIHHKADFAIVPDFCCDRIVGAQKIPVFRHEALLSSDRTSLLQDKSLAYSTYIRCDPLALHSFNRNNLNLLHVAAWRGDYRCLKLITQQLQGCTSVLHHPIPYINMLYLCCNKPEDLLKATTLLSKNFALPKLMMHKQYLIDACFVRRSCMKFLCNSYTAYNKQLLPIQQDHMCDVILACTSHINMPTRTVVLKLMMSYSDSLASTPRLLHKAIHPHLPHIFKIDVFLYCMNSLKNVDVETCVSLPTLFWTHVLPILCISKTVNSRKLVATTIIDIMPQDERQREDHLRAFIRSIYAHSSENPGLLSVLNTVFKLLHCAQGLPPGFTFFRTLTMLLENLRSVNMQILTPLARILMVYASGPGSLEIEDDCLHETIQIEQPCQLERLLYILLLVSRRDLFMKFVKTQRDWITNLVMFDRLGNPQRCYGNMKAHISVYDNALCRAASLTLMDLCRAALWRQGNYYTSVTSTHLPDVIRNYLLFKGVEAITCSYSTRLEKTK